MNLEEIQIIKLKMDRTNSFPSTKANTSRAFDMKRRSDGFIMNATNARDNCGKSGMKCICKQVDRMLAR